MTTFRDPATEKRYCQDGYAVVPLLDDAAVRAVTEAARPLLRTVEDTFAATLYTDDVAYRRAVDTTLRPLFDAPLAAVLADQRCFVANLLAKPSGPGTDLGVHQDWTFVDEARQTSATVWCPLVDVDEGNGTLVVFRGSHLLARSWRGSPRLPTPFDGLEERIWADHGTAVEAKAGHAVVYDHRTVHWSGPNRSDDLRLTVGLGVAPAGVPLIHLHAAADGSVTRYEVPDDFLDDLSFGSPPPRHAGSDSVCIPDLALSLDQLGKLDH